MLNTLHNPNLLYLTLLHHAQHLTQPILLYLTCHTMLNLHSHTQHFMRLRSTHDNTIHCSQDLAQPIPPYFTIHETILNPYCNTPVLPYCSRPTPYRENSTVKRPTTSHTGKPPPTCRHTVYGGLPRQYNHDQLQALIGILQVPKHRFHLVRSARVLAEAGLAHDRHAGIVGDALEILREIPASTVHDGTQ